MKRIEHLGIAVDNLATSIPLFEALLNTPCYKQEGVASEGVMTAFFQVGPNKIELLEATNPDSAIAKFLSKNGPGFHHVAFER
jgi:methylmalonyl-CoA/ethylmalonyl-CoA epimerase